MLQEAESTRVFPALSTHCNWNNWFVPGIPGGPTGPVNILVIVIAFKVTRFQTMKNLKQCNPF